MPQNTREQREPTEQETEFAQFIAQNFRVLYPSLISSSLRDLASIQERSRRYGAEDPRAFNAEVEEFLERCEAEEAEAAADKQLEVRNAERASNAEQEEIEARIRAEREAKELEEEEAKRWCEERPAGSEESFLQAGRRE